MKFNANALDGGVGRLTRRINFLDDQGVVASISSEASSGTVTWNVSDSPAGLTQDIAVAAEQVARMLYRYRDCSLVLYPDTAHTMRGDESSSADAYPPGRQPRIIVER